MEVTLTGFALNDESSRCNIFDPEMTEPKAL